LGFILDAIRLKEVLDSTASVNFDWESPSFSLDNREGEFSVTVNYENGSNVSMNLILQISSDNINFADLTGTSQEIVDDSGMHIWDIQGSGALYARVSIRVSTGNIDVTRVFYSARQRH
jgi:hypothetical protein